MRFNLGSIIWGLSNCFSATATATAITTTRTLLLLFGSSASTTTSFFLSPSPPLVRPAAGIITHRLRNYYNLQQQQQQPLHLNLERNNNMSPPEAPPAATGESVVATTTSTTSPPKKKPMPSFYQRKLPETCVPFASKEGKKIFASALANNGLKSFFPLIQQFTTQTEPAFCGLSTLVLVLNALSVDPRQNWKGPWRWYEESMLNCCIDLEQVKSTGITLRDFQCLAFCQGLSVDLHYCYDKDEKNDDKATTSEAADNGNDNNNKKPIKETTLEDFRNAVQRACVEIDIDEDDDNDTTPLEVLVVSYSRKVMGQTGSGHFSPIAAYDSTSDSVLILDTARFKYGAHWAKLPLVYDAMKPIDPDTGRPRGYALLSFTPPTTTPPSPQPSEGITADENGEGDMSTTTNIQPLSRLFRSRMLQRGEREKYKNFLSSVRNDKNHVEGKEAEIPWEEVLSYWTHNASEPLMVWKVVEPMRTPTDPEENQIVQNMLNLLREMVSSEGGNPSCCAAKPNNSGAGTQVPCVSEETAIYAIYLASLSDETRREKIMEFESAITNDDASSSIPSFPLTKELLICEAEMLASAIDTSDQVSL